MGRPLIEANEIRRKLNIYLTPTEEESISERARKANLPFSTFVRQSALNQKISSVPQPNAERWAELARTAANLNQLAKAANDGTVLNVPAEVLDDLYTEVQALRASLMGGES